jgi:c(7)-type cytochrome triheme protein
MRWARIAALAVLVAGCGADKPKQPLPFSHAVHAGAQEIPCTDCHRGAVDGVEASLPSIGQCLRCHMRPQGEPPSDVEALVRARAAEPGPFRWIQVTRNPGHVYFSHRAHAHLAQMTCADCHGDVATWDEPPTAPTADLVDMGACMSCHRQRGASNECHVCHR